MNNKYFYNHYFKPQHVKPKNMVFSKEHIILSSIIVGFIVILIIILKNKKDLKFNKKILRVLGIVLLSLEIFRISWKTYFFGWHLTNLGFDWCNQICMILPFIAIIQNEKLYPYVDVAAFIGGFFVLIYPVWVFYDFGGIHVVAVQSMLSHGLMVAIPLVMPLASEGNYMRSVKDFWKRIIGIDVVLLLAYIFSIVLNKNYIVMENANGIPIIDHIQNPYYWILVLPLIMVGLYKFTTWLNFCDRKNLSNGKNYFEKN
ncbi:YwaF family protein [Pseudoramibacter sp.]|jgi:uncharacterized membrane protein YwaF|uniref:YwaF family protein n=1 Tax=Pseudoramibacter sp. TaxID=2034862 RepID=UPI0025E421F9|nr:YwaF family protein [Pseudoramibacter sp.]MCH4072834.1 YwaF family protein [Pseudoramibacter sp.]MCH4106605.1 YwaF family protein [Pseudoramibacter sp.]